MDDLVDVNNPLTWPYFPVLCLRRKGHDFLAEKDCLGIIGSQRTLKPLPTVMICNICDVAHRRLPDLYADPTILKEVFPSMEALLEVWEVD